MIEKNAENINQATVEKNQSADPTFQKMSKAFDEGGAKGMLMNNLVRPFSPLYLQSFICLIIYTVNCIVACCIELELRAISRTDIH